MNACTHKEIFFSAFKILGALLATAWSFEVCSTPLYVMNTRYSPPLTNLAAQTEFSQPQKDCSGSSKDAHGL